MLDAIKLEQAGIPSAALVTDAFAQSSHAMAEAQGMAWYPFVTLEHPIASRPEPELKDLAENAVYSVESLLTEKATTSNQSSIEP